MKWILALAVVAVATTCAQANLPPIEKVCVPNESWKSDCNDCICGQDAKPVCTNRECPQPVTEVTTPACREGDVWKEDCNTCRCVGGRAACTLKACLNFGGNDGQQPGDRCTPGAVWKQDCNTCRCTPFRQAACTLMACLPSEDLAPKPEPVANECIPGTTWKKDCNNCHCTGNGLSVCTQMRCLSKRQVQITPVGNECIPGTTWKRQCNTCSCGSNGIARCTLMACIGHSAPARVRRGDDLPANAEPGAPVAEVEEAVIKPEKRCTVGTTWRMDCNTCRCTSTGVPACTKMRCIKPEKLPADSDH